MNQLCLELFFNRRKKSPLPSSDRHKALHLVIPHGKATRFGAEGAEFLWPLVVPGDIQASSAYARDMQGNCPASPRHCLLGFSRD